MSYGYSVIELGTTFSRLQLTPSDIQFFGGKAAHYALLRDAIPANSRPAIAFSFDLWDAFLAQDMGGGATLGEEIAARMARCASSSPSMTMSISSLARYRKRSRTKPPTTS